MSKRSLALQCNFTSQDKQSERCNSSEKSATNIVNLVLTTWSKKKTDYLYAKLSEKLTFLTPFGKLYVLNEWSLKMMGYNLYAIGNAIGTEKIVKTKKVNDNTPIYRGSVPVCKMRGSY